VVGAQPAMDVVAKANHVKVMDHEMKSRREHSVPDPMRIPRTIMEQWNPQIADRLPDAFCGTLLPPRGPLPATLVLECEAS
jgi:anthranilate synthase component I